MKSTIIYLSLIALSSQFNKFLFTAERLSIESDWDFLYENKCLSSDSTSQSPMNLFHVHFHTILHSILEKLPSKVLTQSRLVCVNNKRSWKWKSLDSNLTFIGFNCYVILCLLLSLLYRDRNWYCTRNWHSRNWDIFNENLLYGRRKLNQIKWVSCWKRSSDPRETVLI